MGIFPFHFKNFFKKPPLFSPKKGEGPGRGGGTPRLFHGRSRGAAWRRSLPPPGGWGGGPMEKGGFGARADGGGPTLWVTGWRPRGGENGTPKRKGGEKRGGNGPGSGGEKKAPPGGKTGRAMTRAKARAGGGNGGGRSRETPRPMRGRRGRGPETGDGGEPGFWGGPERGERAEPPR